MTRKFSDIKNDLFVEQVKELNEGVYDPGIFKAFFLAGGPGSGKSYVQKRTTGARGLKVVNSDDVFEKLLKDAGMQGVPSTSIQIKVKHFVVVLKQSLKQDSQII